MAVTRHAARKRHDRLGTSPGSCSGVTTITCALGALASGAQNVSVSIVVTPTAAGRLTNTATVTTSGTDPDGEQHRLDDDDREVPLDL